MTPYQMHTQPEKVSEDGVFVPVPRDITPLMGTFIPRGPLRVDPSCAETATLHEAWLVQAAYRERGSPHTRIARLGGSIVRWSGDEWSDALYDTKLANLKLAMRRMMENDHVPGRLHRRSEEGGEVEWVDIEYLKWLTPSEWASPDGVEV